jgi:hypothetical protein
MRRASEDELKSARRSILERLVRKRIIGGKHIDLEFLYSWGNYHNPEIGKEAAWQLIRENLILWHPTAYGKQCSLNPRKIDEVEEELKN